MRARLPALIALTAVLFASMPASAQSYDVLIRNGRVLDGSGNPYFRADVGIRGDEIVAVGDLSGATADRVVNAAGKYVTPGFIALQKLVGKTLAEVSAERGETPFETAIWLQMNGFDRPGGVLWMAQAVGTEDIVEWMVQDYTAVTLDRGGDRPDIRDNPAVHPGQYGTSGRLIRGHVLERGTITLPHAIRSLTGLAAQVLRLPDRGRLAPGMKADVVVFDPETIRTDATYLNPFVFQEGMTHVLLNGEFVVDDGAPTDALPGHVLRRPESKVAA